MPFFVAFSYIQLLQKVLFRRVLTCAPQFFNLERVRYETRLREGNYIVFVALPFHCITVSSIIRLQKNET